MIEEDDKQFSDDLLREDDVGLVLRGHLHIEHQLIELVSTCLSFKQRCDWSRISYLAKVDLALASGLPENRKKVLEKLNTLRNTFAHSLSATISKKDILDLYNCLSEPLREGLKVTHKAIGRGDLSEPSSLEPRDLLILIFLNVRQAIKAAVITLRDPV
ncbi:MAG: hypothetical protein ACREVH_10160 [Gammaproteobacteria bacterium]